jgi:hypothetical protein
MSADSSWLDVIATAMLPLLAQIESWHLIAAGIVGAALCLGFGRTATLGLVGATLCGAVALTGIVVMWRSYGAPPQVALVTARTVGARGGDDRVEWRFEDARSIFLHSRRAGDALWIDGIRVFAENLSDRPLNNLSAVVRSYMGGKEMKLSLVVNDRRLESIEAQSVPPKFGFSLLYVIPAMLDDRASGIPADQFLQAFGDLYFTFRFDTNQIFARLVASSEIERQISRIEQENVLPKPSNGRP